MKSLLAAAAAVLASSPAVAQRPDAPPASVVAQRVDSLVTARLADPRGPAGVSVMIVRRGEILVQRAWGTADVTAGRALTAASTLGIASISKQFTATLVLKLVDRGRLALTDTLGRHLTGLRPEWRSLTIAQVLNHTSGLHRDYRLDRTVVMATQPTDTLIAWAARDTMIFAPGTRYAYSNTGYMLLGALIERLYGRPYRDALRDEIARPLGLATLGWCSAPEKRATEVKGHERSPQGALIPALDINEDLGLGSGGVCATPGDMARWNLALHGGRVLSPASYTAMTTPSGPAAREFYGFGIRSRPTQYGTALEHDGGTVGFASENVWLPAESLSVTVLSNSSPWASNGPLLMPLVRIALGEAVTATAAAGPGASAAPAGLEAFTGFYEGLRLGRGITITLENGTLYGEPTGGNKGPLVLKEGTTFYIGRVGGPTIVTFTMGADGRATAMTLRGESGQERTFPRAR
jgi:D-alanyl-D-alanine carboxypeptidase